MSIPKVNCIVSAGMPRSGSTWQFNILQAFARSETTYSSWIDDYDRQDSRSLHIVKAHNPDLSRLPPYVQVVTSYRDLRAVAGSMVRMRWIVDEPGILVDMCRNYVAVLAGLEPMARYVSRYENILDHPSQEAQAIQNALDGIDGKTAQYAVAAVDALRPSSRDPTGTFTSYDVRTQLHAGHIGEKTNAKAIAQLSDTSRLAIEAELGDWLEARSYAVPFQQ